MICGENGKDLREQFRPTYFTAKWTKDGSALIEVAIWGPRVLDGGRIGEQIRDHCWTATKAEGGVKLDSFPFPSIARAVRKHAAANGLAH
jgi:hypothetical protein